MLATPSRSSLSFDTEVAEAGQRWLVGVCDQEFLCSTPSIQKPNQAISTKKTLARFVSTKRIDLATRRRSLVHLEVIQRQVPNSTQTKELG